MARAIAVKDKRIVYVANIAGLEAFKSPDIKVIDLNGRMLMPGFIEGHIHPITGAATTRGTDLQFNTHEDLTACLTELAKPPARGVIDGVVRGMGWRYSVFPLTGPAKEDLDPLWPDHPVFFTAVDGHSAWLNSQALRAISDTSNPDFKRNAQQELTGGEVEGKAMETTRLWEVSPRNSSPTHSRTTGCPKWRQPASPASSMRTPAGIGIIPTSRSCPPPETTSPWLRRFAPIPSMPPFKSGWKTRSAPSKWENLPISSSCSSKFPSRTSPRPRWK